MQEEIKKFLPQFLSQGDSAALFEEIKNFPKNIDYRFYTERLKEENFILQGDGIRELPNVQTPRNEIKSVPSVVLSNTCDISSENNRLFPSRMLYSPIVRLDKYISLLEKKTENKEKIEQHVASIRKQTVTQIFYLPQHGLLDYEGIIFLDCVTSWPVKALDSLELVKNKLFTLSDYGFYMFLLKLSVHFTRIRDGISRGRVSA